MGETWAIRPMWGDCCKAPGLIQELWIFFL